MVFLHFDEATPLIDFIEQHRSQIVGHQLKELLTHFWPMKNRCVISDELVIVKIDDYCLAIDYVVRSDISIMVYTEEEYENRIGQISKPQIWHMHFDNYEEELDYRVRSSFIPEIKTICVDYYDEEFGDGEEKDLIEGRIITDVTVERFSDSIYIDVGRHERPAGGDYFSTIRLILDSGKTLCFSGEDGSADGWIDIWCE